MLTSIGRPFFNVYFSTFEPVGMTPNTIFSELRFVLGGSFVNMRLLIPLPRSSCQEVVGGIGTARDPEFWTGLSDRGLCSTPNRVSSNKPSTRSSRIEGQYRATLKQRMRCLRF